MKESGAGGDSCATTSKMPCGEEVLFKILADMRLDVNMPDYHWFTTAISTWCCSVGFRQGSMRVESSLPRAKTQIRTLGAPICLKFPPFLLFARRYHQLNSMAKLCIILNQVSGREAKRNYNQERAARVARRIKCPVDERAVLTIRL
jgi:hypothetical protein